MVYNVGLINCTRIRTCEDCGALAVAILQPRGADDERHSRAQLPVRELLPVAVLAQRPPLGLRNQCTVTCDERYHSACTLFEYDACGYNRPFCTMHD